MPASVRGCLESVIPFPEPQPKLVALLLSIGLWPGGIDMAWKVGRWSLIKPLCNPGKFFIHAVVGEIEVFFRSSFAASIVFGLTI